MAIATVNPATGETVREFEPHDAAAVERRIAEADAAARALRAFSYAHRRNWMHAAADLLEADVDSRARILTLEMGKPLAQARAEVLKSARGMRYYADHAAQYLADEPLADASVVGASEAYTRYEPLGVVLAVMPWNYPFWQVIRFAAPALMAGNAGLLKHASNVPQSALYLDELFDKAGFPTGSFRTLLIGSREVESVIADPRVRAVTLTGSEPAGRAVAATAGREIKKTILELGGSDPFIVMPSADLEAAASTAVMARTMNNGQSCIAGKRFLVHADVYDAFADLFVEKMETLKMGDPFDEDVEIGPLATESGRNELAELVDDAVACGARVLTGGRTPELPGWFYPPTVIDQLPMNARLVMEEAFGPVASLYRVANRDEAVQIANQTAFGLSSAVWTDDPEEQQWFIQSLDAGSVFVNGMTVSHPELPFGGVKASGFGRELAASGIREFTNLKTVWRA